MIVAGSATPALAKPRVSLTLSSSADAAKPIPFSFTTNGLSASDHVVVQRQQGTKHAWRTAVKLSHTSTGSGQFPALPLGGYSLRIAALSSRGKVLAKQMRNVKVYGDVPFLTIFASSAQAGVDTTATMTFAYVLSVPDVGRMGAAPTIATDAQNTCRSAHVEFVPAFEQFTHYGASDAGTVSVVQETRDPVGNAAPIDGFGSFDVALVPGKAWSITAAETSGNSAFIARVNGSASCYGS
jgi:hypothetical protein